MSGSGNQGAELPDKEGAHGGSDSTRGRPSLEEAAVSLVALLHQALRQGRCRADAGSGGTLPVATEQPHGGPAGAVAVDVPLLEAAARGLAHISGIGRAGAEACVKAKAVPLLLEVLRLERGAYTALGRQRCRGQCRQQPCLQQQQQSVVGRPDHRAGRRPSQGPGICCQAGEAAAGGIPLELEEISRPLACLQRRQQQQGSSDAAGCCSAAGSLPGASDGSATASRGNTNGSGNGGGHKGTGTACSRQGPGAGCASVRRDGSEGMLALWALANMVAACAAGRRAACRHGLYTLIRTALACPDTARAGVAAAVLARVAADSANTGAVYRAELRLKQAALLHAACRRTPRQMTGGRGGNGGKGNGTVAGGCSQPECVRGVLQPRRASLASHHNPAGARRQQVQAQEERAATSRASALASGRAAGAPAGAPTAQTLEAAADAALISARWGLRSGRGADAGAAPRGVGPDTAQAQMLLARMTPRLTVRAEGARISLDGRPSGAPPPGGSPYGKLWQAAPGSKCGSSGVVCDPKAAPCDPAKEASSSEGAEGAEPESGLVPSMVRRISTIGLAATPITPRRAPAAHPSAGSPGSLPAALPGSAGEEGAAAGAAAAAPALLLADVRGAFLRWCAEVEGEDEQEGNVGGAGAGESIKNTTAARVEATATVHGCRRATSARGPGVAAKAQGRVAEGSRQASPAASESSDNRLQQACGECIHNPFGGESAAGAVGSAGIAQQQGGDVADDAAITTEDPEEVEWVALRRAAAAAEQYRAARAAAAGMLRGRLNASLCRGRKELWQRAVPGPAESRRQPLRRRKWGDATACSQANLERLPSGHGDINTPGDTNQLARPATARTAASNAPASARASSKAAPLQLGVGSTPQHPAGCCRPTQAPSTSAGRGRQAHTRGNSSSRKSCGPEALSGRSRPASPWEPGVVAFLQTAEAPPSGPARRRRAADRLMVAAAPEGAVEGLAGGWHPLNVGRTGRGGGGAFVVMPATLPWGRCEKFDLVDAHAHACTHPVA
jgi:hypothetical protein